MIFKLVEGEFAMKSNSLCLLHQEPNALLTTIEVKLKVLLNLNFFIRETIIALKAFLERDFTQFDPHVGETSCQIRAYMVFLLQAKLSERSYLSNLKNEIKKLEVVHRVAIQQIVDFQLALNSKNNRTLFNQEELQNFLQDRSLIFSLSDEAVFLMRSYFLTRFKSKTICGDSYINYEKICQDMQITRKLSKKLVRYYQLQLAKNSTQFIFNLLHDLPEFYDLSSILSYLNYADDNNRLVLPCYPVVKIILQHMLKNQCPVLILVERQLSESECDHVCLLFEPNQACNDYQLVLTIKDRMILQSYLLNKACIIIEGLTIYKAKSLKESKSQFINRLLTVGLINIILANMANHPQFPGNKLNAISQNPYKDLLSSKSNYLSLSYVSVNNRTASRRINSKEHILHHQEKFLEMKSYGEEIGCCDSNPSLFFMKHVFCNNAQAQVAQVYKTEFDDSYNIHSLSSVNETYDSLLAV